MSDPAISHQPSERQLRIESAIRIFRRRRSIVTNFIAAYTEELEEVDELIADLEREWWEADGE